MALVRAARKALSPVMASAQYTITRGMSMEGVRGFNEHEKTVEDLYFTKEDQVRTHHAGDGLVTRARSLVQCNVCRVVYLGADPSVQGMQCVSVARPRTITLLDQLLLPSIRLIFMLLQRLFGKLMSKVKQQSDVVDKHAAEGVKAAELSALKPIVDKVR